MVRHFITSAQQHQHVVDFGSTHCIDITQDIGTGDSSLNIPNTRQWTIRSVSIDEYHNVGIIDQGIEEIGGLNKKKSTVT